MRLETSRIFSAAIQCLLLLVLCEVGSAVGQTTARSLFEDTQAQVSQIRVIDIASGDKYSIGSGFTISSLGHVATNFHVVSSYVHEPDKYRLEIIAADGSVGDLNLLAIDVVHDLAIVDSGEPVTQHLVLAERELSKGDRIYSMGNPHDLGMTIIEGTFNGLVKNSRYRKILFSGSLNAGMSGGPALNEAGEVIGVNVSKGAEQLSFLVPVEHLSTLLEESKNASESANFDEEIHRSLAADQQQFYQAMLHVPLVDKSIGKLIIPAKLVESLKCWGHTADEEDIKYEAVHQHCKSEDQIFINGSLYVGDFNYDVEMISTQELNRFQFYNLLEERFDHHYFYNASDREDVTEYACSNGIVNMGSGSWKVSTCLRAYKLYAELHDASMIMVSVDYPDYAAVVKVGATGISSDNAIAIMKRIMGSIKWAH